MINVTVRRLPGVTHETIPLSPCSDLGVYAVLHTRPQAPWTELPVKLSPQDLGRAGGEEGGGQSKTPRFLRGIAGGLIM
jgi:hypothetical protein